MRKFIELPDIEHMLAGAAPESRCLRSRWLLSAWLLLLVSFLPETPLLAQDSKALFREIGLQAGLLHKQLSGSPEQKTIIEVKGLGIALIDYDNDGLLDIFLSSGSSLKRFLAGEKAYPSRLYRNLGAMKFVDVTATVGIPDLGWANAVAVADVDGNGFDDLFITEIHKPNADVSVRNIFK